MEWQASACVKRVNPSLEAGVPTVSCGARAVGASAVRDRAACGLQARRWTANRALPHQSNKCCHTWRPFVTDIWCDTRKPFPGKDLQCRGGRFVTDASRIANPVSPCGTRMSRMSHMSRHLKIDIDQIINHGDPETRRGGRERKGDGRPLAATEQDGASGENYQYRATLGHVGRHWDGRVVYRPKSLRSKGLQDMRPTAGTHVRSCKSFADGNVTGGALWKRREDRYKEQ
jgi:hypothetical protein